MSEREPESSKISLIFGPGTRFFSSRNALGPSQGARVIFRFGDYVLDTERRELRYGAEPHRGGPRRQRLQFALRSSRHLYLPPATNRV
jgi:hypothetical protein